MGIFDKIKQAVSTNYKGNKDFLQAACAAAALVAVADGSASEDERKKAVELLCQNETLKGSFPQTEIRNMFTEMVTRAGSVSGRVALKRELTDIAGSGNFAEDAYYIAVDVAMPDVEASEQKVLAELAECLGVTV